MSLFNVSRRGLLRGGAVLGAGLATGVGRVESTGPHGGSQVAHHIRRVGRHGMTLARNRRQPGSIARSS
ncbi:MAG: twin-arginine translocation signal domain-containing protein [Miltoncostaeaceae bacterium]